jgi:hypothetical protein
MYQHYPVLGPSKYTKIEIFWFENLPSGNPKAQTKMSTLSTTDSNSSLHIFVLFFLGKKPKELANSFFLLFRILWSDKRLGLEPILRSEHLQLQRCCSKQELVTE